MIAAARTPQVIATGDATLLYWPRDQGSGRGLFVETDVLLDAIRKSEGPWPAVVWSGRIRSSSSSPLGGGGMSMQ